ncbi:Hypothetical predicted protein [Podarcis lilfordi]|uniref:Uncharacterized protein n=1 Tax=Podarcis lilfordi TaxID=74358 RepID=A0AA35PSV5_9SAUR|nr:Hypothetical predicted protein [Podarcis lilfordi]
MNLKQKPRVSSPETQTTGLLARNSNHGSPRPKLKPRVSSPETQTTGLLARNSNHGSPCPKLKPRVSSPETQTTDPEFLCLSAVYKTNPSVGPQFVNLPLCSPRQPPA